MGHTKRAESKAVLVGIHMKRQTAVSPPKVRSDEERQIKGGRGEWLRCTFWGGGAACQSSPNRATSQLLPR